MPATRARNDVAQALAWFAVAGAAYFVSARIGYRFAIPQGIATLWPPSGVMLGLLLVNPRRFWAPIFLGGISGSVASDLMSGYPLPFAFMAAFANGLETLIAARFVVWRLGPRARLNSVRGVMTLLVGAAVAVNAVTALLGAWMLYLRFPAASFARHWFVWWVGDGLGMMVVAPLVLACRDLVDKRPHFTRKRVLEAMLLFVLLGIAGRIGLGPLHNWPVEPGEYLVIPFVFWISMRMGAPAAAVVAFLIAAATVGYAADRVGPFASADRSGLNTAMQAYIYLVIVSFSALMTAAVMEERARANASVLESEARYRTAVEGASDAILVFNRGGLIEFANAAAKRIFGFPQDQLVGRKFDDLLARPQNVQKASTTESTGSSAERRSSQVELVTGRHAQGHEVPLEAVFGQLIIGGVEASTAFLRDMSDQRAAERALREVEDRMRFALDASRVGVWDLDHATGRMRWSDVMEHLHGLASGSFGGTRQAFIELVGADDRASIQEAAAEASAARPEVNVIYRSTWPSGEVHWIRGFGRLHFDDAGKPVRATGIALDISEQRNLEEQFRQSQKMEAIGHLAGGVAHDFNNLLTVIQTYTALLADSVGTESPHRIELGEIERATKRATALTRQLLAFSRRQVLSPTILSLADSLSGLESLLRRLISSNIKIVVHTAQDAGYVRADATQIEQVILNLALNARDAMPDGGTLLLEVSNVEIDDQHEWRHIDALPGPYVMLAVSDTGIGMDADTLARVFEPFFTTKTREKGTGLGLSTVHGIINQSGGRIGAHSEPGQGSTFKVYLPRVQPGESHSPAGTVADARPVNEVILLGEDDSTTRQLAQRILDARG